VLANPHRPNILYLTHRVPYPLDKGDRIRSFNHLRYIARRANVHLACLADEAVSEATIATLRSLSVQLAIERLGAGRWPRAILSLVRGRTVTEGAFRSPGLQSTLAEWVSQTRFDAMLLSSSGMVSYPRNEPRLSQVPVVVDLVDVDSQKWFDYAAASSGPKAWLYRIEGRRLRQLEQELPKWARAVLIISEEEADIYRSYADPASVRVVSIGTELNGEPAPPVDGETCTFVGALDYMPNVDGIGWFAREVWPAIVKERPAARLVIVGRKPVASVQSLGSLPGIEVVGPVPEVKSYLARSAVIVAPLRIARGVQNKVLEAMAAGRVVVASPQALAGIRAEPDVHLLLASTPDEWLTAITRLLDAPDYRNRLAAAGRRYVEDHHSWDICLKPLDDLLGLPPPSGEPP
jgi:sugar transferase (PEP-CTERM/EpsH1 system associated)